MTTEIKLTPVQRGLVKELDDEEDTLENQMIAYRLAHQKWEVAGRKYAAVREMVITQLRYDPYGIADFPWPEASKVHDRGVQRFVYMNLGEAALAVLREAGSPADLESIVEALSRWRRNYSKHAWRQCSTHEHEGDR